MSHVYVISRWSVCLFVGLMIAATADSADFWTDISGRYKVEAEYAGMDGKSVILRKSDGLFVKVPLERLSAESRELAKRRHAASNSSELKPATPTMPETSSDVVSSNTQVASTKTFDFDAPVPPPVPPMRPFPVDVTLAETVDFIRQEVLAGHPEVIWYAVPKELREIADSQEYRSHIAALQRPNNDAIRSMFIGTIGVLVTKKDFVLQSKFLAQTPPPFQLLVRQFYDPAIGVAFEVAQLIFPDEESETVSVSEHFNHHGPRIGGHLRALVERLPPGMVEQLTSQLTVVDDDTTHGTITFVKPNGEAEVFRLTKVGKYWLPDDLATKWAESRGNLKEIADAQFEQMKLETAENADATGFMDAALGGIASDITEVIKSLRLASTQEEFDLALEQANDKLSEILPSGAGVPD
ncbi:MAG: SHD1 domain-containing protein [Pirellulaceae bacterium]